MHALEFTKANNSSTFDSCTLYAALLRSDITERELKLPTGSPQIL